MINIVSTKLLIIFLLCALTVTNNIYAAKVSPAIQEQICGQFKNQCLNGNASDGYSLKMECNSGFLYDSIYMAINIKINNRTYTTTVSPADYNTIGTTVVWQSFGKGNDTLDTVAECKYPIQHE